MEIYNFYQRISTMLNDLLFQSDVTAALVWGLIAAIALWLVFFVLQGIGLYRMAKNRGMSRCGLAFVPFANVWLMGKLAGKCEVFGHPVKRVGLWTMILQIVVTAFAAVCIAAEMYLYTVHGVPNIQDGLQTPFWGLTGFDGTIEKFYTLASLIYSIPVLLYQIFVMILMMGLLRQYTQKHYSLLSTLTLFFPVVRYVAIFALRNRKAVDFEAYMRARREAYIRRQQQYGNSYGNPYGNPYRPYGYGNPYQNSNGNGGAYAQPPQQTPPEEPFAEFGTGKNTNATDDEKGNGGEDDGFFR